MPNDIESYRDGLEEGRRQRAKIMPEPTREQIEAARKAMEYWVPWDLRDRLQGPLDAMARVALKAAAALTPD